jgi:hypothetical protein
MVPKTSITKVLTAIVEEQRRLRRLLEKLGKSLYRD